MNFDIFSPPLASFLPNQQTSFCFLYFTGRPGATSPSTSLLQHVCPPELWSVTMVFVSCVSNAIITLNSYSVKRTSVCSSISCLPHGFILVFRLEIVSLYMQTANVSTCVNSCYTVRHIAPWGGW